MSSQVGLVNEERCSSLRFRVRVAIDGNGKQPGNEEFLALLPMSFGECAGNSDAAEGFILLVIGNGILLNRIGENLHRGLGKDCLLIDENIDDS